MYVCSEEFETLGLELTNEAAAAGDDDNDSDDRPVQGPINREPHDKLYPARKESGIRKM